MYQEGSVCLCYIGVIRSYFSNFTLRIQRNIQTRSIHIRRMHHALEIEEILFNIFGHYDHPGDLAALAGTCRSFKDPALDVLWEDLDDLYPLARCLPGVFHELEDSGDSVRQTQVLVPLCLTLALP